MVGGGGEREEGGEGGGWDEGIWVCVRERNTVKQTLYAYILHVQLHNMVPAT